jgi:hypothetical protein
VSVFIFIFVIWDLGVRLQKLFATDIALVDHTALVAIKAPNFNDEGLDCGRECERPSIADWNVPEHAKPESAVWVVDEHEVLPDEISER